MSSPAWSLSNLIGFLSHPDKPVRYWAAEHIEKWFAGQAGEAVLPLLDEDDATLARLASEELQRAAAPARYAPEVELRLRQASGLRWNHLALALAALDPECARPHLLGRVAQAGCSPSEVRLLARALARVGGVPARQALWIMLDLPRTGDPWTIQSVVNSLLAVANPADVRRLVQRARVWPARAARAILSVLANSCGAGGMFDRLPETDQEQPAFDELASDALWQLGAPVMTDTARRGLTRRAFRAMDGSLFGALAADLQLMLAVRGDDLAAWQSEWGAGRPLSGYRRRAVIAVATLEALASPLGLQRERLYYESALACMLVWQLEIDQDDQAQVEQAADPARAWLDLALENRENAPPEAVDRVAALGPAALPQLIAVLEAGESWGAVRAAQVIAQLARRRPGDCEAAIPALIDLIDDSGGDYLLEACSEALAAIGEAAVEPMRRAFDDDATRTIYLVGALGDIPTAAAARAILEQLPGAETVDDFEMLCGALLDNGSALAIPPLAAEWESDPDDAHLAEVLLVLHVINGRDDPRLPEWRRQSEAADRRMTAFLERDIGALLAEMGDYGEDAEDEMDVLPPPPPPPPAPAAPASLPNRMRGHRSRRLN